MISMRFLENKSLLKFILSRSYLSLKDLKYKSLTIQPQCRNYCAFAANRSFDIKLLSSSKRVVNMAAAASTSTSKTNRLNLEKSPYLLQHATNPVDWFPWGEEAFQKARDENKLIFLSVGYSTCHWCHVMEKESFENDSVAAILNANYISIKVDREERPDVDRLYMSYVQRTTGSGGWPMSVFLTPTLAPLFGGTYFPPEDYSHGRVGFKTLLKMITDQWNEDRNKISKQADESMTILRKITEHKFISSNAIDVPHEEAIAKCLAQFTRGYEPQNGGFSQAPKFPQPSIVGLLMHIYARDKESDRGRHCLEMCTHTLTKMAYGGIHDHVNKGFARYSVDGKWHVPHFEKMLYDQAQIAAAYCDIYIITKDQFFAEQVHDVLEYVGRDLGHAMGGFYGAEDADSYPTEGAKHKQEGAFCVWEWDEINNLLDGKETSGVKHVDVFCSHYSVEEEGNVDERQDPHGELKNKNVLACFGSYDDTADKFKLTVEQVKCILTDCHTILYGVRQSRPKPHVDTKIVTSWNGLMIGAFAKAGFTLNRLDYIERAEKAATFIKENMYDAEEKTLLRCCYGEGDGTISQTAIPIVGFLDDYAFLIRGILDLYEATLDSKWLQWAEDLQGKQDELFWDEENSGYFTSPSGDDSILIRDREDQDGAEPCGNSVAVRNLIRLSGYLARSDLREKAGKTLTAFSDRLKKIPFALPEMISALMAYHESPTQVFIAGPSLEDQHTQALLDVLRMRYHPGRLVALADGPQGRGAVLYARHDSLAQLHPVDGRAAAYVCKNFACALPITDPAALGNSLDAGSKP